MKTRLARGRGAWRPPTAPAADPDPSAIGAGSVEQGDAADHQEDDTGGEEAEETTTVGGIVTDLLDTVIVVVGNLLPF